MTDPIELEFRSVINEIASSLDMVFNGNLKGKDRQVAFILLTANFGDTGCINYIANADREDCIKVLKDVLARLESQPIPASGKA